VEVAQKDVAQPIEECFPIFVIPEDPPSLHPPDHHVMKRPWGIYAGLASHGSFITNALKYINNSRKCPFLASLTTQPYPFYHNRMSDRSYSHL
jgi:hypothetical protein